MKLRSFLKKMCNEYQGNFMGWVAEDLLKNTEKNDEDTLKYMNNIILYGGSSGAITGLTYYHEITTVFRDYFEDILEYLNDNNVEVIDLTVDNLVWICYQLIVGQFIDEYREIK